MKMLRSWHASCIYKQSRDAAAEKEAAMTLRTVEIFVTITLWGLSLPLT